LTVIALSSTIRLLPFDKRFRLLFEFIRSTFDSLPNLIPSTAKSAVFTKPFAQDIKTRRQSLTRSKVFIRNLMAPAVALAAIRSSQIKRRKSR